MLVFPVKFIAVTRCTDYSQLGLAAVPFLPYMFDEPVENAIEWTFHKAFEAIGGPDAVGHSPRFHREEKIAVDKKKLKEKEL